MSHPVSTRAGLAEHLLAEINRLVKEAEESDKPLELDPVRSRLFELFVTAHGAGYLEDDSPVDLSADGLCATLSEQWGLRTAALESTANQTRLPPEQLAKMRHLWSLMRMWMEWTYAWSRWDEFHADAASGAVAPCHERHDHSRSSG